MRQYRSAWARTVGYADAFKKIWRLQCPHNFCTSQYAVPIGCGPINCSGNSRFQLLLLLQFSYSNSCSEPSACSLSLLSLSRLRNTLIALCICFILWLLRSFCALVGHCQSLCCFQTIQQSSCARPKNPVLCHLVKHDTFVSCPSGGVECIAFLHTPQNLTVRSPQTTHILSLCPRKF